MFETIILPVIVFIALGVATGTLLAVATKVFAVKKNEVAEQINECLPGANCGGCGFSGCAALAEAISAGEAKVTQCTVGGAEVAEKIAEIMGVEAASAVRMRAQVMCSGSDATTRRKYIYDDGAADCLAEMKLGGGYKGCRYACVGLGNCAKACPFGAISIKNGTAVVDYRLCTGCGNCVTACPKHIIKLIPYDAYYWVGCASKDTAARERYNCMVGCTGCGTCQKACPENGIEIIGNVATINYDKCTGCGMCFAVCPEGVIWRSDIVGSDGLIFTKGKKKIQ